MTQAVLWSACGLLPFAVRLTNALASAENWTFIHEPKRSEWTSLPQHFKKAGWWAAGAGKLYHPGSPQHEDNPLSWSVEYPEDVGGGCSCTPMANYCRLPDNTTCYDVQLTVRMCRLRSQARLVPRAQTEALALRTLWSATCTPITTTRRSPRCLFSSVSVCTSR